MRLCVLIFVAIAVLAHAPLLTTGAPCVKAPLPDEEKPKFSMRLYSNYTKYERGHETLGKTHLYFYFRNNTDAIAYIKEMPSFLNQLEECTTIWYVFRFEDGNIVIHDQPPSRLYNDKPFDTKLRRPLTIPEDSSLRGQKSIFEICLDNPSLRDAIRECDKFSVTLVVECLKLKSNTIYFNGMKEPPPGKEPDALEDLKLYRKRLKEEEERRKALDEEERFREEWKEKGIIPPADSAFGRRT